MRLCVLNTKYYIGSTVSIMTFLILAFPYNVFKISEIIMDGVIGSRFYTSQKHLVAILTLQVPSHMTKRTPSSACVIMWAVESLEVATFVGHKLRF